MNRQWKDAEHDNFYYYNILDGRIVGQVHKVVHTKVWLAKILYNVNEEKYLGMYIDTSSAQNAVTEFWSIEERTLPYTEV